VLCSDITILIRIMGKGDAPYNLKPLFCPNWCPLSLTFAQLDARSPGQRSTHPVERPKLFCKFSVDAMYPISSPFSSR
jgi:hypothetical protein